MPCFLRLVCALCDHLHTKKGFKGMAERSTGGSEGV